MRTRLMLAALCMLALPLWFSAPSSDRPAHSTLGATVAYAGHTTTGEWCGCGTSGCLCDPGEQPVQKVGRTPDKTKTPPDKTSGPNREVDFGSGVLMLAFALFVWARLRA